VDADALLRRVQWTAIIVCGVFAAAALALAQGRIRPAVAVVAGGLLAGISYRLILSGAGALVDVLVPGTRGPDAGDAEGSGAPSRRRPAVGAAVVKLAGRYALLALLAYVMIARLRLHPLGLLAGASSVVAAAAVEAARLLTKNRL
jgi:hypothetical protein